jgi:hypothetical protein
MKNIGSICVSVIIGLKAGKLVLLKLVDHKMLGLVLQQKN